MELIGDNDLNLHYGDLTFDLTQVYAISIDGERRYPRDGDNIKIQVAGEVIEVKWEDVTDNLAQDILLSYLAPV